MQSNEDVLGTKYGRLQPIEYVGMKYRVGRIFLCRCDCGNIVEKSYSRLNSDRKGSCGCRQAEVLLGRAKQLAESNRRYNANRIPSKTMYDTDEDAPIGI